MCAACDGPRRWAVFTTPKSPQWQKPACNRCTAFGSRRRDHAFVTNGFVSHNTEARLTPLARDMLREIDEETVDFIPNYDGRVQEPTVLPKAGSPTCLANGSGGIAVGMATNIPPHNLRELAEAVYWCLDNHEADRRGHPGRGPRTGQGPGLPHLRSDRRIARHPRRLHHGRGSVRMRGVVEVEEDSRGRTSLVITELPYQVNHDNFITSIAEQGPRRQGWPASPTSRTRAATGSACASSWRSSATRWPRWC